MKDERSTTNDLRGLFETYISERQFARRLSKETIRQDRAVFHVFSLLMPEVTSVKLLSSEMVTDFFKRLQTRERVAGKNIVKKGVKNSTARAYWDKLDSFCRWLCERNHITENPLKKTMKPPQPVYDDSPALKKEEVHRILSAIALNPRSPLMFKRDTLMVNLLAFCGLRKNEFSSLRVTDIDMEKQLLTVRPETSKSKKRRSIPIHPTLMLHLQEYIKERNKSHYNTECLIVSSSGDRGLSANGLKHWVDRLNKVSGVKFHLHQLRHYFACNLAGNNVSIVKIQKLMGHSTPKMTLSYLRSVVADDLRQDINKLSL